MKRGIQKIPIHHFGLESVLDSMANSRSEKMFSPHVYVSYISV